MKKTEVLSETGRLYQKRKAAGLCVRCGKPQEGDRVGKRHCLKCNEQYKVYDTRRYHKHKSPRLAAQKIRIQREKDELYTRLGGYVCACCGETEKLFLTLEHKNGGGRRERQYFGGSGRLIRDLLKRKDLSGYEILCMNCNRGKYLNGGICPHKTKQLKELGRSKGGKVGTYSNLVEKQNRFTELIALLIQFAHAKGYYLSFGDAWAKTGHIDGSFHYKRLAIDLNLFKGGTFLQKTDDHKELGDFWESLDPLCSWGGRWNDGNHYSYGETKKKN